MTFYNRIAFFVFFAFTACVNESFLADQYKPVLTVPAIFIGQRTCWDIQCKMFDSKSGLIYTGLNCIYSDDNFKTFKDIRYALFPDCHNYPPLYFGGSYIFHSTQDGFLYINSSSVSRVYLSTLKFPTEVPEVESTSLLILDTINFLFPGKTHRPTDEIQIYLADRIEKTAIVYSSISNTAKVKPVQLFDAGDILILLGYEEKPYPLDHNYCFYISVDGVRWTRSSLSISGQYASVNTVIGVPGLAIIRVNEHIYYASRDKGNTWEKLLFPFGGRVLFTQIIDSKTIYVLVEQSPSDGTSKIAKSFDGGLSWELVDTLVYGRSISFADKLNGLATSNGLVQVTNDGGNTWRLIAYTGLY